MLKPLFAILHKSRALEKIVGNNIRDFTASELKTCRKLETVLVSSSSRSSVENHAKSKVTTLKFPQDPKLKVDGISFQYFPRLMGHYNYSLSVNATIIVPSNCPIIGEQVALILWRNRLP